MQSTTKTMDDTARQKQRAISIGYGLCAGGASALVAGIIFLIGSFQIRFLGESMCWFGLVLLALGGAVGLTGAFVLIGCLMPRVSEEENMHRQ